MSVLRVKQTIKIHKFLIKIVADAARSSTVNQKACARILIESDDEVHKTRVGV
jgi:hypothetical protein